MTQKFVQASAIALATDKTSPLMGIIITGQSGTGKTSVIIDLIETCHFMRTSLIADDIVLFKLLKKTADNQILLFPPDNITGLLELRNVGIFKTHYETCNLSMHIHIIKKRSPLNSNNTQEAQESQILPRLPSPQKSQLFKKYNLFYPQFTLYDSPYLTSNIKFISKNLQNIVL